MGGQNITSGSTILLVIQMYSAGSEISALQFHLTWEFPRSGEDYLDGTCLMFRGSEKIGHVDYHHKKDLGMHHSGDKMHSTGGRHEMNARMVDIPGNVDKLFFALSAYSCKNIALFPNPSVRIFDGKKRFSNCYLSPRGCPL